MNAVYFTDCTPWFIKCLIMDMDCQKGGKLIADNCDPVSPQNSASPLWNSV